MCFYLPGSEVKSKTPTSFSVSCHGNMMLCQQHLDQHFLLLLKMHILGRAVVCVCVCPHWGWGCERVVDQCESQAGLDQVRLPDSMQTRTLPSGICWFWSRQLVFWNCCCSDSITGSAVTAATESTAPPMRNWPTSLGRISVPAVEAKRSSSFNQKPRIILNPACFDTQTC